MKALCGKCQKLYEQESSNISDYCLHCKEIVLKSFYNIDEKRDDFIVEDN